MNLALLKSPEPKGKLDAMTTLTDVAASAVPAGVGVVNGPSGLGFGWDAVRWRHAEDQVRRLRQRIFTATQDGDLKRVRNLQKLTAPRSALLYPRLSREEFEGRFLDLMPYLEPKGEGNHSMAEN